MYNIMHLLILGSLLLGSEIFFMFNIFIYLCILIFFQQQVSMIFKQQIEYWN